MDERKKIVIINDDVDLCLLMKAYFLRNNYDAYTAHTFIDAIPLAKECQPNIILLTSAICPNREEAIKKIKEVVPAAEIIIDGLPIQSRF